LQGENFEMQSFQEGVETLGESNIETVPTDESDSHPAFRMGSPFGFRTSPPE
jgi:hypothetical protein